MPNHYETLGVTQTASADEIKSAFKKLAMQHHPDRNGGSEASATKFKEINEAYSTVSDPQKRAQYDAQLRGFNPHAGWQPGPGFNQNQHHNPFGFDINDVLRDIHRQRGYYDDARNRDIVLNYQITLEEAFTGKETELKYNIPGKGTQTLKLKIPAGADDGLRIRYQGKGDDSMKHVTPGDLYVRLSIIPHPTLARMGPHLVTQLTVDYLDAILGCTKEITDIEGNALKLKVPAGVQFGQHIRAAGKGMPIMGQRGDMMIEINIVAPDLNADQKKQLEKIRSKKKT